MGVNSSAIEKIDSQIKIIEEYPLDDDEYLDDKTGSIVSTTSNIEVLDEDTKIFDNVDETIRIDKLDYIDNKNDDVTVKQQVDNDPLEDEDNQKFLLIYIGIVLFIFVLLVIYYFLFK